MKQQSLAVQAVFEKYGRLLTAFASGPQQLTP